MLEDELRAAKRYLTLFQELQTFALFNWAAQDERGVSRCKRLSDYLKARLAREHPALLSDRRPLLLPSYN